MPKSAPKSPKTAQERSKMAEHLLWTARNFFRAAPELPNSPQDGSKRAREGLQEQKLWIFVWFPKDVRILAFSGLRTPKRAQETPKRAEIRPKRPP